jgi:lysophospholipase L1-like esterase
MSMSLRIAAVLSLSAAWCAAAAQTPGSTPAPQPNPQLLHLQALANDFANLSHFAADNASLPADATGRVVFFGDSITIGWSSGQQPFFPGKPYVNRGISGQTTPQLLLRFRQDVIGLHPQAVIILAGTNDIAGNTGPSTLEMIEDNLQSMAELGKANHIRIIVASVLPASDYPWRKGLDPAPKILALNTWIRNYCAADHLIYLDYYGTMAGPDGGMKPGISKDGVHPNAAGYAIMAPLAERAIAQALRK